MAEACRRLFMKPSGLTEPQAAELHKRLTEAVETQNGLAKKTPHILRFSGNVQQGDGFFFVEHEPVTSLSATTLFDPSSALPKDEDLLRVSGAIVDALRIAHDSSKSRPVVHGGLCPGTIVFDSNGIYRVTDFGFAKVVSDVLGIDSYVNLAVGPAVADSADEPASAVWAVDQSERDDHICAFIDPEKYAGDDRLLATFETGSDIIAAGFILHLLAEHKHPYLDAYPNSHRSFETSKWGLLNSMMMVLRREDLKQSSNPGVRLWCDLVEEMLAPLPGDRPSAASLAKRLAPHVPKIDTEAIMRAQEHAEAQKWLAILEEAFKSHGWNAVEVMISQRPQLTHWPDQVRVRAGEIQRALGDHRKEEALRAAREADTNTAREWAARLCDAVEQGEWDHAAEILAHKPSLSYWPDEVDTTVADLTVRVGAEIKDRHDREAAELWASQLSEAVREEAWTRAAEMLASVPEMRHLSEEAKERVADCQATLDKHVDATKLDSGRALAWLNRAKSSAKEEDWRGALELLDEPPADIHHWPDEIRKSAAELRTRCEGRLAVRIHDRLTERTRKVHSLADTFVRAAIESGLKSILSPAAVRISTASEQFTSEANFGEGEARLSVELPGIDSRSQEDRIALPFTFILGETTHQVTQAEQTRDQLMRQIRERLGPLQESRLEEWGASLREGLFPDAGISAKLKELSPRIEVILVLLGRESSRGRIRTRLNWDPVKLNWEPHDPEDLVKKASAVAVAAAQEALFEQLAGSSKVFSRYRPLTNISLAAVAEPQTQRSRMPDVLEFEGQIALRDPKGNGGKPGWTLQRLVGRSPTAGQVEIDGGLVNAEKELRRIITTEQNLALESLNRDLKGLVKSAPKKMKLRLTPTRIKHPVDEIAFELRSSGKQPLTISGVWNAERLEFDLPSDWKANAGAFCEITSTPAVSQEVSDPAVEAVRARESKPSPERRVLHEPVPHEPETPEVSKANAASRPASSKWRRSALIGGGAVAAAVAGLLIAFGLGGEERPTPVPTPPPLATTLAVKQIGVQQVGKPFDVEIIALDDAGNAANVAEETTISLRTHTESAGLSGIIKKGTISAGQSTLRLDGVVIDSESDGIVLVASAANPRIREAESPPFQVAREAIRDTNGPVAKMLAKLPFLQGGGVPQDLDKVLQAIIPGGRRSERTACIDLLTKLSRKAIVSDHDALGEDGVSFQVDLGIEDASAHFKLNLQDESWQAAEQNVESFDAMCKSVRRRKIDDLKKTRKEIQSHYFAGKLVSAHGKYDEVAELLDLQELNGSDVVQQLRQIKSKLPPLWNPDVLRKDAYQPSNENNLDTHLGYPRALRTTDGERTMLLVSVPPRDPIWKLVEAQQGEKAEDQPWYVFYIDSRQWKDPLNTIEDAEDVLSGKPQDQRIPTRREWMLAALKLYEDREWSDYSSFGFLGGKWEWCKAEDGEVPWVCGGCELLPLELRFQPNQTREVLAEWLKKPLVQQKRRYGDGLTTLRPILRIYPTSNPGLAARTAAKN